MSFGRLLQRASKIATTPAASWVATTPAASWRPAFGFLAALVILAGGAALSAQSTTPPPAQTPVPRPNPFPVAGAPPAQPAKPPVNTDATARPTTASADLGAVDPKLAGIAGYPGSELLDSYDAGKNQRLFVFGTNDSYEAVLAFYKTQYKKAGEEVSRTPRIQQFDIGNFDANTMAQRPSVIVKDYLWPDAAGYLHVVGTTEKRFKTLIQIIPTTK